MSSFESAFRRCGIVTVATIYLLILVGGIVRATGSGMGCPDWPLCFGKVIPPTDVSQLPPDYKTKFAVITGKEIADFNVVHTYTEYINRLLGVLTGLFIFLTAVFSTGFRKKDATIMWLAILAFFVVVFEGWLGSRVVASDLKPAIITLHGALALVTVMILLYAVVRSHATLWSSIKVDNAQKITLWLSVSLVLLFMQMFLGTQVREGVDILKNEVLSAERSQWLGIIGTPFYIHRSFTWLVVGSHLYMWWLLHKSTRDSKVLWWRNVSILSISSEILLGIILGYADVAKFAQPLHLLFASVAFGANFVLVLMVQRERFLVRNVPELQN